MNYEGKVKFICNLFDSCRDAILERVKDMPESWDGMELRQYIAEEFARQTYLDKGKENKRRYRDYKNDTGTIGGL